MGAKCKIFDKGILTSYELGYKDIEKGLAYSSQVPKILFLERCLDLLKPGGKLGIVMTKGILSNEKDKKLIKVRRFIKNKAKILSIIDLPRETFLPHTGALTCALLIEKNEHASKDNYPLYMANPKKNRS